MLVTLLLILRGLLGGLGPRHELMLENLALRHRLQVALRTNPRPRLRPRDRACGCGFRKSGQRGGNICG